MRPDDRDADESGKSRQTRTVGTLVLSLIVGTGALVLFYFYNDRSWTDALTMWSVAALVSLAVGWIGSRLGGRGK